MPWNFIRNPHAEDWSLTENPGSLRLKGSKRSFNQKDSPAFVGRRQSAFNAVASTKLAFIPTAGNEEAGLVVRANDTNHYDLLVTLCAGKRVLMFRSYLQDKVVNLNYKEISEGDIILRISATESEYKFWVQKEGYAAEAMGTATTKDISTEKVWRFTGTYIGMYASVNGKANVNPADFDWFDFEENTDPPYEWAGGEKDTMNGMDTPVVISAVSESYDKTEIRWNNIDNETGYIIERFDEDGFVSAGETPADDTVFSDNGLTGSSMYIYRVKAKNDSGYSHVSLAISIITLPKSGPFFGTQCKFLEKLKPKITIME